MELLIDVQKITEGDIIDVKGNLTPDGDILNIGSFDGDVAFGGWLVKTDKEVSIGGEAKYAINHVCDLCGENFKRSYTTKISAVFTQSGEDESFKYDGVSVNVGDAVREAILLAMPLRILCRPNCKGLCSKCGKNLNDGKCDCNKGNDEARECNSPFALLKNINFPGGATNGSTKE